ncbi:hypothetical protein F383_32829 [Gossypium arboreum]|uniref:Uncharacterized protein n=1 Tax=Gossypium arboreum TaxID=29729 RepID=A0A0B0PKA2_GOSAR|nr:hypothetical protein F383_32829 [Gossypium arboreum]
MNESYLLEVVRKQTKN